MDNRNKCNISKYPEPVRECLTRAIEFQQNMYELSSDWNYYEETEHDYLKNNIKYAICGESNLENSTQSDDKTDDEKKKQAELEKVINFIYEKILEASRTKNSLYVGVIFNVLCESNAKVIKDKKDESFGVPIPIFKVRRCMDREEKSLKLNENNSSKSEIIGQTALYPYCVSYIDSEGRVYKNWTDYVTNNTLPKCLMVLPMGGFYQMNPNAVNKAEKTHAWIEVGLSPAANVILPYFDIASTVLGTGALGVGIVALAAPIAAPVMVAGSICGAISGAYTTARSSHQLVDRHQHQQSISPSDRSARSAWFGAIGGVAGGLASGSSFVLTKAVRAGVAVGTVGRATYNTITIGNIVINGIGIGNGVWGIIENYHEKKEFSVLEIGQVVAHILFFGNAVMNFQTAKTIINNTQQQVLQDYEGSLRSNRHKKAFRRIKRNTQATSSDETIADSEIIRGIRSIKNKDDFFAGVVRNRKVFSASKAEVTFKDGYAMINDNVRFDPMELSQQPNDVRANTVSAAQPLIKAPKSALPQSNKMTISDYTEQLSAITAKLRPLFLVPTALASDKVQYIGRLILDMQGFTKQACEKLILELAEFALYLLRDHRRSVTSSLAEIMHYIWHSHVREKVNIILQDLDVDVTSMAKFSGLADLVFDVTMRVIHEMYDAVENLLEEIRENFSQRVAKTQAAIDSSICSVCSGHALRDS